MKKFVLADESVCTHISEYLKKNNMSYDLMFAIHKSNYPDDDYLYMVVARNKKNGTMAVWTCWNEKTQSLNYGHYDLISYNKVYDILNKFYFE